MLAKFSVKKPYTVVVGILLILILGFISITKMSSDLLPSMNIPYAIVMTTMPGSTPEEIEKTVTAPIESAMTSITDIKNIKSMSYDNYSAVILEFSGTADMNAVTIDMRESLDILKESLPDGAGNPTIIKINPDMLPIVISSVSMEGMPIDELTEYVKDKVIPAIESVEGVGEVSMSGGVTSRIEARLNDDKIKKLNDALNAQYAVYGITFDLNSMIDEETVSNIINAQNFDMPAGYIENGGDKLLIRVGKDIDGIKNLEDLIILNLSGNQIYLKDIADITVEDDSANGYTSINGEAGIILSIQKQTGYSTADVTKRVLAKFDEMMEGTEGLSLITIMDQGVYIKFIVNTLVNNMIVGGILAIIILFLFLRDLKPTLVVACSIPVSVVTALVLMYFSNVTINAISLSGLSLGIGMLVDNSIVVMENIYRLRSEGKSIKEAAIEGANGVSGAIIASTLTTACVFLPIVFTEGITRQLFVDMGLTIAYSLLASLIIAMTFVPMMSKVAMKNIRNKDHKTSDKVKDIYGKALSFFLDHKWIVFVSSIAILIGSGYLAYSNGTAFMPSMDSTQMSATITMDDKEATIEDVSTACDEAIKRILTIDGVEAVGANYGSGSYSSILTVGSGGNAVNVYILVSEDKTLSNEEIAKQIAEKCKDLPFAIDVEASVMDLTSYIASGMEIDIKGPDLDELYRLSGEVKKIVEGTDGLIDITSDADDTVEGIMIEVDKEKASKYNITVAQVYLKIADKLSTTKSSTSITDDGYNYDVFVKPAETVKLKEEDLEALSFEYEDPLVGMTEIQLKDIANIYRTENFSKISRNSKVRYVSVKAGVDEDHNIGLLSTKVQKELDKIKLKKGYSIEMAGEDYAIKDAIKQLMMMLIVAIAFIYLIMVATFQSLKSPFIIMFTIPLAVTGGFLGLVIARMEISVISMLGFIILAGVIANNGIVLVDYMNQLIDGGMPVKDAIIEAGRTRLRPIFMTALTTILAMSTLAFGVGMGAEMGQPMAVVTIGGLTYGTLLTLFVVPCLYYVFNKRKVRKED